MKISFIAPFALAATASASSLRKNGSTNSGAIQTKVALKGVSGNPSKADMDFIGKALISSYNHVHWQAGHFLTGQHSTEFVGQL
jgi:hypothetical protein